MVSMRRLVVRGSSTWMGIVVGLVLVAGLTAMLLPLRRHVDEAGFALVLLLPVVVSGVIGASRAAAVTGVVGAAVFSYVFDPPAGEFKVRGIDDILALVVFLTVAVTVGLLVAAESDRRRAAEQRALEVQALYLRNQELAEEAARAQLLERVDEHRAAIMRSVSHDLRTPLATIRAVASDLRAGAAHDERTRDNLLDSVCAEAERLDRIVANLLSMSRIEAGILQPSRQAVDLEELVADRVRRLGRLFEGRTVRVGLASDLPLVHADYTLLDQLLTNLLENAARHAPVGTEVAITSDWCERGVHIRVVDHGLGVPDEEAEKIFEPFQRGAGSASSGVGLAICRAIAEAHGGSIHVETTPGGGATFVVDLPAVSADAADTGVEHAELDGTHSDGAAAKAARADSVATVGADPDDAGAGDG